MKKIFKSIIQILLLPLILPLVLLMWMGNFIISIIELLKELWEMRYHIISNIWAYYISFKK